MEHWRLVISEFFYDDAFDCRLLLLRSVGWLNMLTSAAVNQHSSGELHPNNGLSLVILYSMFCPIKRNARLCSLSSSSYSSLLPTLWKKKIMDRSLCNECLCRFMCFPSIPSAFVSSLSLGSCTDCTWKSHHQHQQCRWDQQWKRRSSQQQWKALKTAPRRFG